jgi:hypothetical protein
MKSFETVADLVNNAISMHREAAGLYRELEQRSQSARARLVLEYLIKHEQQMETGVKNRLRAGTPGMLATYIQYTFEDAPKAFMAALAKEFSKPDADQVCEIALRVDGILHRPHGQEDARHLDAVLRFPVDAGRGAGSR